MWRTRSYPGSIRPVVIVSQDAATIRAATHPRGMITVIPITSNVTSVYEFQALLSRDERWLPRGGKAQAEQVRAISVSRVVRELGTLSSERMAAVDDALRVHLGL